MIRVIVIYTWAVLMCCFCHAIHAQVQDIRDSAAMPDVAAPINVNIELRNRHLWRGFNVANMPIFGGSFSATTKNRAFEIGIWTASTFNGVYRAFTAFANLRLGNFELNVIDSHNTTGFDNAQYFNYDIANTRHFIDVNLVYRFGEQFPLTASLATIVTGRDTYLREDGTIRNRYSNYFQVEYRLFEYRDLHFLVYAGAAFSLVQRSSFYGSKPNVVNTGFRADKTVTILKHDIPVFARAMWNPEARTAALGLGFQIF